MSKVVFGLTAALALTCDSCSNNNDNYSLSDTMLCNDSQASGTAVFFRLKDDDTVNDHMIMWHRPGKRFVWTWARLLWQGRTSWRTRCSDRMKASLTHGRGHPHHGPDKFEDGYADRNIRCSTL